MYDNFYPRTRHLANRLIDWLQKRPTLHRFALNLAKRHDKAMGYRKFGLYRDDLIPEEHPIVYQAVRRLSDKEAFDRTFRLRRAIQLHLTHNEMSKAEQQEVEAMDHPYLWKHIEAICRERDEKVEFDNLMPAETEKKF